jgi:sulfite exporter TauE/SafE
VDAALIVSCALLGLASAPHCAAMCGPACAAATCAGRLPEAHCATLVFHGARAASYAAVGALGSAGVAAASLAAPAAPALRPFWVLLHCAALALGLWLAATGRQPRWMMGLAWSRPGAPTPRGAWQPIQLRRTGWAAGAAGALWAAWPCGMLQAALVVAVLCESPASGALAMGGFALASAPGLVVAPVVLARLNRGGASRAAWAGGLTRLAVRASGAALAGGALFALNRDAWQRLVAYCSS